MIDPPPASVIGAMAERIPRNRDLVDGPSSGSRDGVLGVGRWGLSPRCHSVQEPSPSVKLIAAAHPPRSTRHGV